MLLPQLLSNELRRKTFPRSRRPICSGSTIDTVHLLVDDLEVVATLRLVCVGRSYDGHRRSRPLACINSVRRSPTTAAMICGICVQPASFVQTFYLKDLGFEVGKWSQLHSQDNIGVAEGLGVILGPDDRRASEFTMFQHERTNIVGSRAQRIGKNVRAD